MDDENDKESVLASVILLSYNSHDDLIECIPSLRGQSYKNKEIILVDNSPVDDSDELKKAYPEIKYLRTGSNLGYPGGNNAGAKLANGKYIIVVNPDTVADNDWLEQLIKPLEDDPGIALTSSKVLLYGHRGRVNTFSNQTHFTGLPFCKGLGEPSSRYLVPEEAGSVSGCSFAIRKDVFTDIGSFDADFFLYLEDIDLSWRARLAGYKILTIPGSVIYHKYKLSVEPWKELYLERNRYQVLLKNFSGKMLFLSFPALIATETITWGYAILKGTPFMLNKLKAYWWTMANFGSIMEKRRRVQQSRKISDKEFIRLLEWRIPFEQLIDNRGLCAVLNLTYNTFYKMYFSYIRMILTAIDA
jgi:GT2 family glycosyltransferase